MCFQCTGGKVQQMLAGIQSSDEGQQLQSVIEMCQVCYRSAQVKLITLLLFKLILMHRRPGFCFSFFTS